MSRNINPWIIDLEITNLCNTSCDFCPREKITRPLGNMTEQTFKNILKQLKKRPPYLINFSGLGECLLHPRLEIWIKKIKKSLPSAVGITTNGLALAEKKIRNLLRLPLDFITISFNGNSRVSKNIKNLTKNKAARYPLIHLSTLKKQSRTQLRRLAKRLGIDGILIQPLHNRGGYLTKKTPKRTFNTSCQIYKNSLFINWEGKVLSCCHDLQGENFLGDLNKTSLGNVLKKKNLKAEKINPFPICRACNDALRAQYFSHHRYISCKK